MARKSTDEILAEAEQIARVWAENPSFTLGDLTLAKLQTMIADLRVKINRVEELRTQQVAAINEANVLEAEVRIAITRGRSGIRAFYGPDSSEYEQSGGTRTSDRKRPVRRAKSTNNPDA